jgi:hypothetical protein
MRPGGTRRTKMTLVPAVPAGQTPKRMKKKKLPTSPPPPPHRVILIMK